MSNRLLGLVLSLAVVSAALGAGAALLLRSGEDVPQPAHEVSVVAPVRPEEQQAEPAAIEQAEQTEQPEQADQARSQPEPAVQRSAGELDGQEESAESDQAAAPAQSQAAQPEVEQPAQQAEPPQSAAEVVEETRETEQPAAAEAQPTEQATVSPEVIVQGEAFALTVVSGDARAAAATLGGRSWDLGSAADGTWWGIIAVPRDAELGVTDVLIDLYGEGGVWLRTINQSIVVLANTAPLEEVDLGGTGVAADPAAVARDIAVRFTEHTAVTGPPRWRGEWILPVEGEVTGVFGARRSYDGVAAQGWHHGHDIAAQHGDPLVAPAHGAVVWTGELVLHGMGVIIDHGAGVYSGYWHMSLVAVRAGHEVAPGDWLGNIGTTGLSTGPHLHWEVIVQGVDVDPVQWLGEDRPPLPPGLEADDEPADTIQ